jgi:hypothetical protein
MFILKDLIWKIRFLLLGVKFYRYGGGGGKTTIQAPSPPAPPPPPPSPGQTAAESIQAQLDAIPKQLSAEKEFGPQFIQASLDQLRQFGGQFTEEGLKLAEQFGPRLSEITRSEQEALAPERVAGSDAIAEFIKTGGDKLTDLERDQFLQDIRAAQQTRGLGQSGFGAVSELEQITGLRQSLKDRFLNVSLSASGRLPAAGGSSVATPGFGNQGLVQNVSPQTFFGGQASNNALAGSIFGSQANVFGAQSQFAGQQLANSSSPLGSIIGGVAGSFLGGVGGAAGANLGNKFFK